METFADRLRALIGEGSRNGFAKKTGVGETSLRQYLTGGTPGLDKVILIARATGVSITWLATGEGPRDSSADSLHVADPRTQQEQDAGMKPLAVADLADSEGLIVLQRLAVESSAGPGIVAHGEEVVGLVAFTERFLRSIGVNPRAAHVTTNRGDSMYPTLRDGELMIVDTSIDRIMDEGLYSVVFAGRVLSKRLQILRDGTLILKSDNKGAGIEDVVVSPSEAHELHVVGRIMWAGRTM